MPEFKSKEEYEKWKIEKQKEQQQKISIDTTKEVKQSDTMNNKSPHAGEKSSKKRVFVFLAVGLILLVPAIILSWYYISSYQPKRVADEYLKAIQLHDISKIEKLSGISKDSILINLLDWKFIDKKRIPSRKVNLDLSEEAWRKEVQLALTAFQESSVDFLPLPDLIKAESKDYGVWFDNRLRIYKPFKEDGNYYYIESPKVEYQLDITATNKLGAELKKKYILVVDRWGGKWHFGGEWKVIKFEERE